MSSEVLLQQMRNCKFVQLPDIIIFIYYSVRSSHHYLFDYFPGPFLSRGGMVALFLMLPGVIDYFQFEVKPLLMADQSLIVVATVFVQEIPYFHAQDFLWNI